MISARTRCVLHQRSAYFGTLIIAEKENFLEFHFAPLLPINKLNVDQITGSDLILFAACFNNCIVTHFCFQNRN